MEINQITEKIIGAAIEIHKTLVPGLLESAYEECLCYELSKTKMHFRRQVDLPVVYKEVKLDCGYRIDLLVEEEVIVELKTVERLLPIHEAQILTYLKMMDKRLGLLINFNVSVLRDGIKSMANKL
ncbi:GxxExxY protein [bacterium]|nr:GxxExxY protein [bacterium]